jgi:serine phosphatase RsbU (regulator of sigma subunit)
METNYNMTAEAIIDQCYMSVEKFSESSLLQDDISIIIMKIN